MKDIKIKPQEFVKGKALEYLNELPKFKAFTYKLSFILV